MRREDLLSFSLPFLEIDSRNHDYFFSWNIFFSFGPALEYICVRKQPFGFILIFEQTKDQNFPPSKRTGSVVASAAAAKALRAGGFHFDQLGWGVINTKLTLYLNKRACTLLIGCPCETFFHQRVKRVRVGVNAMNRELSMPKIMGTGFRMRLCRASTFLL